ncbi:uncharacterized protein [Rutidosis leptorrhynchoides]|uniref:uncharacterized protein n=1 Tax=Rutidosis leptorrhynchoides TaxID=125765 RepID=UPI003A98FA7B
MCVNLAKNSNEDNLQPGYSSEIPPTEYRARNFLEGLLCCVLRGLLDDDQEYIDGIKEVSTWGSSHAVRNLFAQLLLTDSLSRLEYVFEKAFEYLSVNIIHHRISAIQPTAEMLQNMTLNEIEKLLQRNASEHCILIDKLTEEQCNAYDTIVKAVHDNRGGVFFLYGYGGTGKTFLWRTLSAAFCCRGEIVLNVASGGIAALLLHGGRTAHSHFAIPINPHDESFCNILPSTNLDWLIRRAKLIIWDEAPMVNRICIETLDRSLRDICRPINPNSMDTPFGGKIVVFGGDFRQILPVITRGTREQIVGASLNSSYLWDHVTVLTLTVNIIRLSTVGSGESEEENQRKVEEIQNFADWLLSIGNGTMNPTEDGISEIEMPEDVLINDVEDPIGSIINSIYPQFLENLGNPEYYQQRAILAPTHEIVNIINE